MDSKRTRDQKADRRETTKMADDQTNDAAVGDGLIADGEQKP